MTDNYLTIYELVSVLKHEKRLQCIVLSGSYARKKHTPTSDIDFIVLQKDNSIIDFSILIAPGNFSFINKINNLVLIKRNKLYFELHLISRNDFDTSILNLELLLGNFLVYSNTLLDNDDELFYLKQKFLPFYDEETTKKRLAMLDFVIEDWYCNNIRRELSRNKDHIYIQTQFEELMRRMLQYTFILKNTYPLSYDKWIEFQFMDILNLPKFYSKYINIRKYQANDRFSIEKKMNFINSIYSKLNKLYNNRCIEDLDNILSG